MEKKSGGGVASRNEETEDVCYGEKARFDQGHVVLVEHRRPMVEGSSLQTDDECDALVCCPWPVGYLRLFPIS